MEMIFDSGMVTFLLCLLAFFCGRRREKEERRKRRGERAVGVGTRSKIRVPERARWDTIGKDKTGRGTKEKKRKEREKGEES